MKQNPNNQKQPNFNINKKSYSAPTLFVLKHVEEDPSTKEKQAHFFGAYMSKQWGDKMGPQGDTSNFLFSLYPNFRIFEVDSSSSAESPFAYLNTVPTSTYPFGLGFGGS